MKNRNYKYILTFLVIFLCSQTFAVAPKTIDLTKLGATIQYATVYNMLMDAEQYANTKIKMDGIFYENSDPNEGELFQCIMVNDNTGCCMAGFDILKADKTINFPKHLTQIEVTGTFEVKEVNGLTRSYLVIDSLKLL